MVKSEAEMTRHERIMRHGELSQLRKMKKTLAQQNSGNKRKILKTDDTWEIEPSEFEEDSATDIKDVDFRLKNNPSQVQVIINYGRVWLNNKFHRTTFSRSCLSVATFGRDYYDLSFGANRFIIVSLISH